MNSEKVAKVLRELEEKEYTGSVTFNFHNGVLSKKIEKKEVIEVNLTSS